MVLNGCWFKLNGVQVWSSRIDVLQGQPDLGRRSQTGIVGEQKVTTTNHEENQEVGFCTQDWSLGEELDTLKVFLVVGGGRCAIAKVIRVVFLKYAKQNLLHGGGGFRQRLPVFQDHDDGLLNVVHLGPVVLGGLKGSPGQEECQKLRLFGVLLGLENLFQQVRFGRC